MQWADSSTESQRQLRESAAGFLARSLPEGRLGDRREAGLRFDLPRWKAIAELGWLGAGISSNWGGSDLDPADLVALHQEIGRSALPDPLIAASAAAWLIAQGDESTLKAQLLPGLLNGEALATIAWQSHAGQASPDPVGPRARKTPQGYRLQGNAFFVQGAPWVTGFVVAAEAEDGLVLGWVPTTSVSAVPAAALADGSLVTLRLDLEQVGLPADHLIATGPSARQRLACALDQASLYACAQLLGAMERTLEITVTYLKQRVQFGQPIGHFQALQHAAVDVYVRVEIARAVVGQAAQLMAADPAAQRAQSALARAKHRCSEAGLFVAKRCIQMHGAIAYTQEYALSRYLQRIVALAGSFGTATSQRRRWYDLAYGSEMTG